MDGNAIAERMRGELKAAFSNFGRKPSLAIIQAGENAASSAFIARKEKTGEELGVGVRIFKFPESISGGELRENISKMSHDESIDGIVVQLPLPAHLNVQDILNAVIPAKDVDMLSARSVGDFATGKTQLVSPVVGAVQKLLAEYNIDLQGKKIVIVGAGRLVGQPIGAWLARKGIGYALCTDQTPDISLYTKDADVIITGAGKPKLITGSIIKEGVVIIDAGTSESDGKLAGDVDAASVSEKAAFLSPVPGGVGPLTVAMIFENLLKRIKQK